MTLTIIIVTDMIPHVDSIQIDPMDLSKKLYFKTYCSVDYVSDSNPNIVSSVRTWHKKLQVIVTSSAMEDTIRMTTIYSYWNFK